MAASRVVLLRAAWCRASSSLPALSGRPSLCALPRTLRCFPPSPLLRRPSPYLLKLYSFATAATAEPKQASSASFSVADESHPWPEWVAFLERLRSKGYFDGPPGAITESDAADGSEDLNRVKFACLSFARDRFDILRSLSKDDIKTVVGHGCPNLFRKPVHSAKRLRAFVKLDEGEVCSSCNLRGSCDRAYINAEEGARTVDVVRILLNYAADPLLLSRDRSHEVVEIEASARRLLAKLTEMSNTPVDPALSKPAVKPSPQQERQKSKMRQDNVEMQRGDWICPSCNFMNFARNLRCLECKEEGPKNVDFGIAEMKKGDWTCPNCNFMNFSRNTTCKRCDEPRPKGESGPEMEVKMKLGDWVCSECQFMNFARNTNCRKCKRQRQRQLNPGEWECPSCDFLNFRRNSSCLKCNTERPEAMEFGEQIWKRPYVGTRMVSSRDEDDHGYEDEDGDDIDEDKDDRDYDGSSDSKLKKEFPEFMPIREGGNKFVTSKRRSPSERRLTSGRSKNYL
ncbi:zinc finger protein VAR3, chloroplastic isoform X1 [Nymphaea colorata]|nr:zinc finger protein VAR3, chloroplastic isoform X1 [Nymphaea colorata]